MEENHYMDEGERAARREGRQLELEKAAQAASEKQQPLTFGGLISLGQQALQNHQRKVQERGWLPNTYSVRRTAFEENQLNGQSYHRDRLIRYGKHSIREIETGLSDTWPKRLL